MIYGPIGLFPALLSAWGKGQLPREAYLPPHYSTVVVLTSVRILEKSGASNSEYAPQRGLLNKKIFLTVNHM